MKSIQSDRSNFDHRKGVKIFTFEKLYTRGANLHPKVYPHANYIYSVRIVFNSNLLSDGLIRRVNLPNIRNTYSNNNFN